MRSRYLVVLALLLIAGLVVGFVVTQSYAQECGGGGGGSGCSGGGGPIQGRSGVATAGDSVYVLVGKKLQQYDRNLNLIREIKIDCPAGEGEATLP